MHPKSVQRVLVSLIALAAGAFSLVAVTSAPASAATTTTAAIAVNRTALVQGGSLTVKAGVVYGSPRKYATSGKVQVQRRIVGQSSWTTLYTATLTASKPTPTWNFKPNYSARYRVLYLGSGSLAKSVSKTPLVRLARNLHDKGNSSTLVVSGRVTPAYKGTLYIMRSTCSNPKSSSCKWTVHKALKTTSSGSWKIKLPTYSRRTHFRGLIKPSGGFLQSYTNYIYTTWRG